VKKMNEKREGELYKRIHQESFSPSYNKNAKLIFAITLNKILDAAAKDTPNWNDIEIQVKEWKKDQNDEQRFYILLTLVTKWFNWREKWLGDAEK